MANLSIEFLGAAGTVTGSKHLLKTPEGNFLIDCGLFQGLKDLRLRNWLPLPVDVTKIKAVLLTHAHLDHCGYLPLLGKLGFRGKIYCTPPTRDLTEIILRDSAKIQEEDALQANRHHYTKHDPAEPLYTERDVDIILPMMQTIDKDVATTLSPNLSFTYRMNGHILGSAFIEIKCFDKTIVFSGDVGRPKSPLLHAPTPLTTADYLVMESTYGDRLHPDVNPSEALSHVITDTVQRRGNVLIPSFAVGRAQELMHLVNELKRSNKIPDVPVYMDSPMGANATDIFKSYPEWHALSMDQCNAIFDRVEIISRFEDSLQVMETPGPKIVIAASGMLTGGRVLNYLERYAGSPNNTLLFVGYQSEGTRGRALQDGVHEVKLHGKFVPVRAQINSIGSMSGHADQKEMLDWLSGLMTPPKRLFLVHGEDPVREAFRVKIESTLNWQVSLPQQAEELQLN